METNVTIPTRRKNIDIREDVFKFLSVKAASEGTNLKRYIERLLERAVEDMDEASTYQYLCKTRPEGNSALSDKESEEFENWLGL